MYPASDYWFSDNQLHYTVNYGGVGTIDMDQLDLQRTVDENAKRGVRFTFKPSPNTAPTPDTNSAPATNPAPNSSDQTPPPANQENPATAAPSNPPEPATAPPPSSPPPPSGQST